MKIHPPPSAQSEARPDYAGAAELWAAERYLVNYNQDLIAKLTRHQAAAKDVLEFGAGIGTLASLWEQATGVKPECLEIDARQRSINEGRGFRCHENLESVDKKFDVIYTFNVLEHIPDDQAALQQLHSRLKAGGCLVIYVPAFQILYSELDEKIGHYRRYQKSDLLEKLRASGFAVTRASFADCLGFFAWLYVKARGYSADQSQDASMKVYDRYIFPFSRLLDAAGCKYFFGKNILVYSRRRD